LNTGPGSEKPSRSALLCDPRGELRIAVPLFGPVELVWWLAVRLAWLVGMMAEEEPGIRWLGIGWRRVDGVAGGALPTYWIGFPPHSAGGEPPGEPREPEWGNHSPGWQFRDYPHCPPAERSQYCGYLLESPEIVVLCERSGVAEVLGCWGPWCAAEDPVDAVPDLVRVLRAEIADAEGTPILDDVGDELDEPDGDEGAVELSAISRAVMQRQRASLHGAIERILEPLTPTERSVLDALIGKALFAIGDDVVSSTGPKGNG
jgi:hypothetical protein